MGRSLAEILASGGAGDSEKISEFVGKTLLVGDFEYRRGSNGEYVIFDAVVDGEEKKIRTGAVAVVDKLEAMKANDLFPAEVKVTTYPTKFGNPGYDLVEA